MGGLETKLVWRVVGNEDCTEGRGPIYTMHLCEKKSTAIRLGKKKYVQGGDCPIEKEELVLFNGRWCGPVKIIVPTDYDLAHEEILRAAEDRRKSKEAAIEKAKSLGLSSDEVAALRGEQQP